MKKYIYTFLILFFILSMSGCAQFFANYGSINIIPPTKGNVTIQDLIDKWKDYNIYYAGYGPKLPLGVMFDPKDNDTRLTGKLWKPVQDKKTLVEIIRWIYPYTQHQPYLSEILGPHGRVYGYLYYSYGPAVFKKIGKNEMYVYNLQLPYQHDGGEADMR